MADDPKDRLRRLLGETLSTDRGTLPPGAGADALRKSLLGDGA